MTADLTETEAPAGYILDDATYPVAMPPIADYQTSGYSNIFLFNISKAGVTDPTPPTRTTTGL